MARENMEMRQRKAFTYHDRKVRDDVLQPNTDVYVFQPRETKLQLRWEDPHKVVREEHPSSEND